MAKIDLNHLNKIEDEDWRIVPSVVAEKVGPVSSESIQKPLPVPIRSNEMTDQNAQPQSQEMNAEQYFQLLQQAENMKAEADKLKSEAIAALNADREKAVAHLAEIDTKLEKMGVGTKKRGPGRPTKTSTTTSTGEPVVRRPRQKNDKTLKEAIVEVLSAGKANLQTIAEKIIANGYKSNSVKFANTVRVQLYRLEDDNEIVKYEDNTFELKKKA